MGSSVAWEYDEKRDCFVAHHATGVLHIGWQEKEHFGEHEKLDFLWEK